MQRVIGEAKRLVKGHSLVAGGGGDARPGLRPQAGSGKSECVQFCCRGSVKNAGITQKARQPEPSAFQFQLLLPGSCIPSAFTAGI